MRICEATGFIRIGFIDESNRRKPLEVKADSRTDWLIGLAPEIPERTGVFGQVWSKRIMAVAVKPLA
jgi:hypothetical protein